MSRYDGLIIPRSYNDYFSRSDPQAIQRVVKMATDETLNINSENPIQNKAVAKLVPATASETNQLADKNFVNSTVGTNTANYIYKTVEGENVPFDSVAELEAYTGTVTQNDYAFVTGIDDDGNRYYDRYKANETEGVITWGKEYRLNNSSFTAEQWAAIESGITAEKIAAYDAGITPPVDYVEAEEMAPVTSNAVANELETNYYNKQTVEQKFNGFVKKRDVSISGIKINQGSSPYYYNIVNIGLPNSATPIGVQLGGSWDERLNISLVNDGAWKLSITCYGSSFTIPQRSPITVLYI